MVSTVTDVSEATYFFLHLSYKQNVDLSTVCALFHKSRFDDKIQGLRTVINLLRAYC
jgi:hypothetical protein